MSMQTNYKGYILQFHEHNETWTTHVGDGDLDSKSLAGLKAKIDKVLKSDFERVECWMMEGGYARGRKFVKVWITSDDPDEKYNVWTIDASKSRSKCSRSSLYPTGSHNDRLVNEYSALQKEISALEQKRSAVIDKMMSYEKEKKA